ncbi:MAG: 4Fe-4S dicluster domain-containing protein [Flavobacteriaceae bacterium]|nr:MAG: 4Fe-4S dicluster domain-containing protein [Flavobacteriaceae bacterium]
MASNKKYWQSVEELKDSSVVETLKAKEFVEEIPTDEFLGDKDTLEKSATSRRDFLKYVGFTTAAASLAACEGPVRKAIPYVMQPNDLITGVADWYATTMADGFDFANILVKTREGRPILVMPNKDTGGTTNARVQASVLSLYDHQLRLKEPTKKGKAISWAAADTEITTILNELKNANDPVVLLTGTMASPSTDKIIAEFIAAYPNVKHVVYDAVSESGTLDAFEAIYGKRALPGYHFDKAQTIVSFGADFLGDWQGGFEKGYAASRNPDSDHMSYHIQFEANMSLTGANADKRVVTKPSDQVYGLINLYNNITGSSLPSKETPKDAAIKEAATALQKAGSRGVVVTGLNDKKAQLVAMAINKALGSEIMDVANPTYNRQGNDSEVAQLVTDMKWGKIGGLIAYNVDPVYSLASAKDFSEGLEKLKLSVIISEQNNATANAAGIQYVLPATHFLESWGDVMITEGHYGLTQPTIQKLFNANQLQGILLKWSGNTTKYYDYLKAFWQENILEGQSWNKALHDGFFIKTVASDVSENITDIAAAVTQMTTSKPEGFELSLYTSTALGDGKQANNPWLQEFPDPITRASWDNYLTMSIADAEKLGFTNPVKDNGSINGNYAKLTVNGVTVENIPVIIQPGQAIGSVGLALGYGRKTNLKKEMQVGVNAYKLYANGNNVQYGVTIEKTSGPVHEFACIQIQKTIAGRHDILKEVSLKDYNDHTIDPKHTWNKPAMVSYDHKEKAASKVDLWDKHPREMGHHFNLSIDLNSCTGCGACIVACHAENNVPVVGKEEVRVGRDMHWLRIDRYYSSEIETREEALDAGKRGGELFEVLERSAENPTVTFQPMMCQHCNHAPCETVCPVAATSHGRQGQNQMAYNRCVGTRYCANNCPYRVRRFNWFNYADNDEFDFNMNNEYGKMVLNPDVVVRSRGVMEKCSMCIQMTQATILKAKKEGRKVETGAFATACSSACTTEALTFGDVNNEEEEVTKLVKDKRAYHVLDYLQTKPNVVYQVKVRNTNER